MSEAGSAKEGERGAGHMQNAGKTSETEEEEYMEQHFKLVVDFLDHLKSRGDTLPPKAKKGFQGLKAYLRDFEKKGDPNPVDDQAQGINLSQQGEGSEEETFTSETSHSSQSRRSRVRSKVPQPGPSREKYLQPGLERIVERSSSDSSSSRVSRRRRKKPIKREVLENTGTSWTPTTEQLLRKMAEGVDNRRVPDQAPFDDRSGEDLRRYLGKFEEYCRSMYKGSRDLWISELERHLKGRTLEAFRATRDVQDTYNQVKDKLLDWHDRSARERKAEYRKEFYQVRYSRCDSFYLHSVRMERLFRLAYPTRRVDTSKTLRSQFVSTLPTSAKARVEDRIFSFKAEGQPVTWTMIQRCAKTCDEAREVKPMTGAHGGQDDEEEIVIHVGRESNNKPRNTTTQHRGRSFQNSRSFACPAPATSKECKQEGLETSKGIHRWTESARVAGEMDETQLKRCYCNRLGHVSRICRKRLGLCFRCGGTGHQARDCKLPDQKERYAFTVYPTIINE